MSKPKDIQFMIIEDKENKQINTWEADTNTF